MSSASGLAMGSDSRANVLPVKEASGPGFLGPDYNPADEMLHVLARKPCPDYKYMIDTLLFNGISIDDGMPSTPLE